jgi:ATP-binding protein involved in chromosome partitioning
MPIHSSVQKILEQFISPDNIDGITYQDRIVYVSLKNIPVEAHSNLKDIAQKSILKKTNARDVRINFTREKVTKHPASNLKKIIVVASGKGGVGKSTITVNLGVSLAKLGLRVGVLDADIYGPSIPLMTGIHDKPKSDEHGSLIPFDKFGVKWMSIGFMVPQDSPVIWRGPMIQSALLHMLFQTSWGELDVLLVDMPPGTGDIALTLSKKAPISGAIIVSTPQRVALADAIKGLQMFQKVNVPILGMIENMSHFVCATCHQETPIFQLGGITAAAKEYNAAFLGSIPLTPAICEASDQGTPIAATNKNGAAIDIYTQIAKRVKISL